MMSNLFLAGSRYVLRKELLLHFYSGDGMFRPSILFDRCVCVWILRVYVKSSTRPSQKGTSARHIT